MGEGPTFMHTIVPRCWLLLSPLLPSHLPPFWMLSAGWQRPRDIGCCSQEGRGVRLR